jgi:hypothetical protein
VLVSITPVGGGTFALQAAIDAVRNLFPPDSYPLMAAPEGNAALVVERFGSPTLARALAAPSAATDSTDGAFIAVYLRDSSGAIERAIVAAGEDVDEVIAHAR